MTNTLSPDPNQFQIPHQAVAPEAYPALETPAPVIEAPLELGNLTLAEHTDAANHAALSALDFKRGTGTVETTVEPQPVVETAASPETLVPADRKYFRGLAHMGVIIESFREQAEAGLIKV